MSPLGGFFPRRAGKSFTLTQEFLSRLGVGYRLSLGIGVVNPKDRTVTFKID